MLGEVLQLDDSEQTALVRALVDRALAHREESGYLRFEPALPHFLAQELRAHVGEEERAAAQRRWVEAYAGLVEFLYQQKFTDNVRVASYLAVRELPNLLRVLDEMERTGGEALGGVEGAIDFAARSEGLLEHTPERRALATVAAVRARLAALLGGGETPSHAGFIALKADIARRSERGDGAGALHAARPAAARWDAALASGAEPYEGAAYDRAVAHGLHSQALLAVGRPEEAYAEAETARLGFERLAVAGDRGAVLALGVCLADGAACLQEMGRLDEAAEHYERAVELGHRSGDPRGVAARLGNLATVRMLQGRLGEALKGFDEARQTFERLAEPRNVAVAWHQMGLVLDALRRYDEAQQAYKRSLAIKEALSDRPGAAGSLHQLGASAARAGRLEEAVGWARRAVQAFQEIHDEAREATARNNLADDLRRLGRLDEALGEAQRAAAVNEQLGIGAEPWKTWNIIHQIQAARGDAAGAAAAREKAVAWYRRYRAQGGAPTTPAAKRVQAAAAALQAGEAAPTAAQFDALAADPDAEAWLPPLARALAALLSGDRAAARAALPTLDYDDAVELELLLDSPGVAD